MLGRFAFVTFVIAVPLVWLACSSSDAPSGGTDSGFDPHDEGSTSEGDSAAPPKKDSATDGPVGPTVMCSVGGAVEVEPNDTPDTATPFTALTFCGVLSPATDVDYSTFDTPAGKKLGLFQAVVDGKVDFSLTLNGQTFGPEETTKFGSGTYLVKASTSAGQPASYNYRVQFDPE